MPKLTINATSQPVAPGARDARIAVVLIPIIWLCQPTRKTEALTGQIEPIAEREKEPGLTALRATHTTPATP